MGISPRQFSNASGVLMHMRILQLLINGTLINTNQMLR